MPNSTAKHRRPTLGFFVSELENPYAQTLCSGITDAAAAADANVIIFPGKSPKVPYNYRYQYNAIYKLATKEHVDALILATGTMVNFLSDEEFKEFYDRYIDIPLVSISIPLEGISSVLIDNTVGLREALQHLTDTHMFERIAWIGGPESNVEAQERFQVYKDVLKSRGIAFDPSLVVTGDFTKYSGVRAIEEFLDSRKVLFQAIAAANDEMALSAMEELQKRGFNIPNDIAVIGFDNVESAHYSSPSLTTVAQPIYEQAYKAVELAFELIKGEGAHNVTLPTSMIQRESCGCFSRVAKSADASISDHHTVAYDTVDAGGEDGEEVSVILRKAKTMVVENKLNNETILELLKELTRIIDLTISDKAEKLRHWQNAITEFRASAGMQSLSIDAIIRLEDFLHKVRMLLLEAYFKNDLKRWDTYHKDISGLRDVITLLIHDVNNTKAALRSIVPGLKDMGITSFYVFLHDTPEKHNIDTNWNFNKKITLVLAGDDQIGSAKMTGESMHVTSILNSDLYPKDRRYTFVVSSLFYMDEHIGFVVCEPNFNDIYIFESLTVEISCSLKLINLVQTRQKIEYQLQHALEELERYNEQLSNISETDELTGLHNRRGFLSNARHLLGRANSTKRGGMILFGDLDGLKGINDTYGHEEGDNAIKAAAAALRKSFRETDILARLGGDEFTVLTINASATAPVPNPIEVFEQRIQTHVDEYNATSGKPYRVSISVGMLPFNHGDPDNDIESLMSRADTLLYEKKKARGKDRTSVLENKPPAK